MPMTIQGTGTITGLVAGGLPDATVTTAEIVDANITPAKLSGGQSGAAPVYGARAWCVFNGALTGTNAPLAGGNVTSVTRNAVGDYTINFTTAMPSVNFSVHATTSTTGGNVVMIYESTSTARNVNGVRIFCTATGPGQDCNPISVSVFA